MNFEYKFREIFYYVGVFGITQKPLYPWQISDASEDDKIQFKMQVHKGFRIGQALIIEEILLLYKDRKQLKLEYSEARENRNEEHKKYISIALGEVDYRIKILRHLADFIAWQMLGHQYFRARRFYSGDTSRPDLLETNLDSVIESANHFHKKDPQSFALITDLTTFIDVGDLLVTSGNTILIVECKSGSVQHIVNEFIEELKKDDWKPVVEKLVKANGVKKTGTILKQATRTLNQISKGSKLTNFLLNEGGKDTFSDKMVDIYESKIPEQRYYDELIDSFKESILVGYNFNVVEDIVYYAVIRDVTGSEGYDFFSKMLDDLEIKSQKVDYLHQLNIPIKQPLFTKPLGKEVMIELLMGRVKLFLALDLDGFIEMFKQRGISARWMSRKETNKFLDSKPQHIPYMYNHQSIMVEVAEHKFILGSQFLTKILLDNIKPSSFIDQYKSYLGTPIDKSSKKQ